MYAPSTALGWTGKYITLRMACLCQPVVAATLPSLHHHVASWNPARCLNHTSSRTTIQWLTVGWSTDLHAHDQPTITTLRTTGQQPPCRARISSELPLWCIGSADDHHSPPEQTGRRVFWCPPRETFATGRTSVTSTLGSRSLSRVPSREIARCCTSYLCTEYESLSSAGIMMMNGM